MAIASTISSKELIGLVNAKYVGTTFEVALLDSLNSYVPGTTVTYQFMVDEIEDGVAGYSRQSFTYVAADVSAYVDDGIPLARKAATFSHDNSGVTYDITHVVLLRVNEITASISGTTLSVTAAASNTIGVGQVITGSTTGRGTGIISYGTGTGGTGTYTISSSQSVASTTLYVSEIVSVSPLAATATLSDGNDAVFYFDLKQYGYYQV